MMEFLLDDLRQAFVVSLVGLLLFLGLDSCFPSLQQILNISPDNNVVWVNGRHIALVWFTLMVYEDFLIVPADVGLPDW